MGEVLLGSLVVEVAFVQSFLLALRFLRGDFVTRAALTAFFKPAAGQSLLPLSFSSSLLSFAQVQPNAFLTVHLGFASL